MFKKFVFLIIPLIIFINGQSLSYENALTLKQQLDRIQEEIRDLNKAVFNKSFDLKKASNQENEIEKFTALDISIYDLEIDIKNLTLQLEELYFKFDDLLVSLNALEQNINTKIEKINFENQNIKKDQVIENNTDLSTENKIIKDENTLGKLIVSSDNISEKQLNSKKEAQVTNDQEINNDVDSEILLLPEEIFQLALDQMRLKKYNQAKEMLKDNPNNQLSGSAHFWLGKIYIVEKNYREAVFVLGEGVQKYPKSIKAPNMLYELSNSLFAMNKKNEGCKTLSLINDGYKKSKIAKLSEKKKIEINCNTIEQ